jgi:hypothetical protein
VTASYIWLIFWGCQPKFFIHLSFPLGVLKPAFFFLKAACNLCLSVRVEQLVSHWTDFHVSSFLNNFPKSVKKIEVYWILTRMTYLCTFMILSRWIILRMKYVSDESFRGNQSTHFVFNNFPPSRIIVPLWDNVVKYGRVIQATYGNVTRRTRIACWINKTTDTRSDNVLFWPLAQKNGYVNAVQY